MQAFLKDFAGGSTKLCYIQELATCMFMFVQRVLLYRGNVCQLKERVRQVDVKIKGGDRIKD